MRISYFCYNLDYSTGTGPRKRIVSLVNGMSKYTDWDVEILTKDSVPTPMLKQFDRRVKVHNIVNLNPLKIASTIKKCREILSNRDIVHVPLNVLQAIFVRFCFSGRPIVTGVGMQPTKLSASLLKKYVKPEHIFLAAEPKFWLRHGFDSSGLYPPIDIETFKPYSQERIKEIRKEMGISENNTVVLFVGQVSERKGADIFYNAFNSDNDREITPIIIGDGPLRDLFKENNNFIYLNSVRNDYLPFYFNLADVTLVLSKRDVFPIVGFESLACGTPVITTATLSRKEIHNLNLYTWSDSNYKSVIESVECLLRDKRLYRRKIKKGLNFIRTNCSLKNYVDVNMKTYEKALNSYK